MVHRNILADLVDSCIGDVGIRGALSIFPIRTILFLKLGRVQWQVLKPTGHCLRILKIKVLVLEVVHIKSSDPGFFHRVDDCSRSL